MSDYRSVCTICDRPGFHSHRRDEIPEGEYTSVYDPDHADIADETSDEGRETA